ncbi:MAG: LytR C-terminal domain-containing protein [Promicromonosporaceae bacterium]|nr:LytR C-terminal domain-containing protein [Promicromonosporaceae bacterium]
MSSPVQDPARVARRRREHERQAAIYGVLVAVLVLIGLFALAVYTGAITPPFARGITQNVEAPVTAPCLPKVKDQPDGALPVAYGSIHLNIYNASGVAQIATANKTVLERRGFVVGTVGDYTSVIQLNELRFGEKGIVAAYTVAAQFPRMRMVLDARTDASVSLLVGKEYDRPLDEGKVTIAPDHPLKNMAGCKPATELTPSPAPAKPSPAAKK